MPSPPEITAIILAAGFSSRMGAFKPLMHLADRSVIERVVNLYARAGIHTIRVVVGHRSDDIGRALANTPVSVVENPEYARGMFSSVVAGIRSLPDGTGAFFVHPVDIPLVRDHTIRQLKAAMHAYHPMVALPACDHRQGHPPLIQEQAIPAIMSHDGRGGLRTVLGRFAPQTRTVTVADEGILLDLDTPADARVLMERCRHAHVLTPTECRVLMQDIRHVDAGVDSHCRKVARVARVLAEAANQGGGAVDTELAWSAARVHDLARGRRDHAGAGAALLEEMGLPAMAHIVAVHMNLDVDADTPLDAAQIVHLADKLVAGDRVVGMENRFKAKLEVYGHDPNIAAAILRRRQSALTIGKKVVRITGSQPMDLVEMAGIAEESHPCTPS